MNICFFGGDPFWSALGNNGGSRTILKSAAVLRELGHRVDVVAVADNFTWFKHPHILRKIPKDADAVIAISISDIRWMHKQAPEKAKRFFWMRGYETWRELSPDRYEGALRKQAVIVNSTNLKLHLESMDIKPTLCYAGLDDNFQTTEACFDKENTVGFLGRTMHASKRYDLCEKLMKAIPEKQYAIMSQVPEKAHNDFYNHVGIWFAPTESEGFHNPPAEACLRGAVVVCNRMEQNGMMDYATDETSMRYDIFEEAIECVKNPDFSKVAKMQAVLRDKIGTRKQNMERFVKILKGEIQ